MFNNIGRKIIILAEVICWIGIIASVILGIWMIAAYEAFIIVGIITAVLGSLISWVSSFVLCGFGKLIENSDILVKKLAPNYVDDINETKEYKLIATDTIEKHSHSSWADKIKTLSDEELQERIDSEDWQDEYKALCKKELESRK